MRVRYFWATVCKTVRPLLWDRCLSCLPVCNVGYCGQTVGWIKMPLGTEVGLRPGHIVLVGDPTSPPRKGAQQHPPLFSSLCSGTVAQFSNCCSMGSCLNVRTYDTRILRGSFKKFVDWYSNIITRYVHHILSLFSIDSCNWNALGLAFLFKARSDSIAEELFILLFQPSICGADNVSLPQNCPLTPYNTVRVFGPTQNCWASRHRFSRFCRPQDCDRLTDRQTDHATPSV